MATLATPGPNSGSSGDPGAASLRHSRRARLEEAILPPLVALLLAVVVGDLLILSFGQSPGSVYRLLLEGTWGNWYGLGQVLYKATTLAFTGLGVAYAMRAGLFNIGAEGQFYAGAIAATWIGAQVAGWPGGIAIGTVWFLTAVNIRGVKTAGQVQFVTTILKVVPLIAIGIAGIAFQERRQVAFGLRVRAQRQLHGTGQQQAAGHHRIRQDLLHALDR